MDVSVLLFIGTVIVYTPASIRPSGQMRGEGVKSMQGTLVYEGNDTRVLLN